MNEFTEIAAKLGPERCQGALRAFEADEWDGWDDCALACAYGERGTLSDDAWKAHGDPDRCLTDYRDALFVESGFAARGSGT